MKFHGDGTEVAGTANMFDSLFLDYIFERLFGATGNFVVVVWRSSEILPAFYAPLSFQKFLRIKTNKNREYKNSPELF